MLIRYRFDDKLFNLRRLQAKSKVQTGVLDELLYSDDMVKNANSEIKMQNGMDRMSQACDSYDLTISTKKRQPVTWKAVQRTNHHCEWTKTASC